MKKSGAEIIIEEMKRQGVEVTFGMPGGTIMPFYDALYGSGIKHILIRHEQGASMAADGYAQRVMVDNLLADDAQEGITAFLEKRDPKWAN